VRAFGIDEQHLDERTPGRAQSVLTPSVITPSRRSFPHPRTQGKIADLSGEGPQEDPERRLQRELTLRTQGKLAEMGAEGLTGPEEEAERRLQRELTMRTQGKLAELGAEGQLGPEEEAERRKARETDFGATQAAIAELAKSNVPAVVIEGGEEGGE